MTSELNEYIEAVTARALNRSRTDSGGHSELAHRHAEAAASYAAMGTTLEEGTRARAIKRAVLRVLRLVTADQVAFNGEAIAALRQLADGLERLDATMGQESQHVRATVASLDAALGGTSEGIETVRAEIADIRRAIDDAARQSEEALLGHDESLRAHIRDLTVAMESLGGRLSARLASLEERAADLGRQSADQRGELLAHRARVDLLLKEARRRLPAEFDRNQLATFAEQLSGRFDSLYSDFELQYRGTTEEIKEKLRTHVPQIDYLAGSALPVVDIGSGRGEWLELMREYDIPAYGIDINAEFVESARKRGLDMRLEDAVEHLHSVPERSIGAVTAFHIVEHLEFGTVVELLDACLRALAPGGLVLFETPNPTNIVVGSSAFYLDPTHERPLHPQLLEFVVAQRGFVDVTTTWLHAADDAMFTVPHIEGLEGSLKPLIEHLNWAFFGPLDYAVSGWKPPGRHVVE